jgi:hypothetical protein
MGSAVAGTSATIDAGSGNATGGSGGNAGSSPSGITDAKGGNGGNGGDSSGQGFLGGNRAGFRAGLTLAAKGAAAEPVTVAIQ